MVLSQVNVAMKSSRIAKQTKYDIVYERRNFVGFIVFVVVVVVVVRWFVVIVVISSLTVLFCFVFWRSSVRFAKKKNQEINTIHQNI